MPSGFEGYFDATASGMMESLVYVSAPLVADATLPLEVGSYPEYKQLVMSVQGTVDDATGAIWVNTEDCLGQPAAGVALSLAPPWNEGTDPFYFVGGSPAPASTQAQTSDEAIGGFADVTPGRPVLDASLASNGELYARVTSAYVRSETLTVIWLQPTPL